MLKIVFALFILSATTAMAFDLQGHRGARGLEPENTLPSFARAIAAGASTLELDVGISADGAIVVAHDRRLNPEITRDASGAWIAAPGPRLRDLSLAEIKRFDVGVIRQDTAYARSFAGQGARPGTAMPTLAEVVALAGAARPRFNIETKISPLAPDDTRAAPDFARAVIAEIRRLGIADRTTLQSFDWRTLALVRRRAPGVATAALSAQRPDFDTVASGAWTAGLDLAAHGGSVPRLVQSLGAPIWSPNFRDLTPERLAEARALGLRVIPWTVNDPADIERLMAWGVDGLISDDPALVLRVLKSR